MIEQLKSQETFLAATARSEFLEKFFAKEFEVF